MAGLGIRVYTDEDVHARLAPELRRLGYDAVSCHERGNSNQNHSDEWQLQYATDDGRAIIVHNTADYAILAQDWGSLGKQHSGIIVVDQVPISELLRRVRKHLDSFSPQQQYNLMLYVPK